MTRPRSNALTGPSDPRYRSPAEIALYAAAKTPIPVAEELEEFLKKVFARKDLMETLTVPNTIVNGIYSLYSDGGGGTGLTREAALQSARNVWLKFYKTLPLKVLNNAFFQYGECPLSNKEIFDDDDLAWRLTDDFLYFRINAGWAACRVYLNVTFESMPDVVLTVLGLPGEILAEIVDLKTGGPGAGRADSVVIYCKSLEGAQQVAKIMLAAIIDGKPKSAGQTIPAMTTRVGPGVSIGAEPKPQETGLAAHINGYPRDAQSFGSIRSQVIAAAILNYRANTAVLGAGFSVFKQLAAVGFKGNGLDPASPGS